MLKLTLRTFFLLVFFKTGLTQSNAVFDEKTYPVFSQLKEVIKGKNENEIKSFIKVLKEKKTYNSSMNDFISAQIGLSMFYFQSNELDSLKKYSKHLLNYATQSSDSNLIYRSYFMYSFYSLKIDEIDSAMFYLNKTLDYSLFKKDTFSVLITSHNLMIHLKNRGEYDSFFNYSKIREQYIDTLKDTLFYANEVNLKGVVYGYQGDYLNSYKAHSKALKLYKSLHNKNLYSKAVFDIGLLFRQLFLYNEAIEYFKKGLSICSDDDEFAVRKADFNLALGDCFTQIDSLEIANNYLSQSLQIHEKHKRKSGVSKCYLLKAKLAFKGGDTLLAKNYMNVSLELTKKMKNENHSSQYYYYSGDLFLGLNLPKKAIEEFMQALQLSPEKSLLKKDIHKKLSEAYYLLGDAENYVIHKTKQEEIFDQGVDLSAMKKLFALNNDGVESLSFSSEGTHKIKFHVYYVIAALLLGLFFVVFYLKRKKKTKQRGVFNKEKFLLTLKGDQSFSSFMIEFEMLFPGYLDGMKKKYDSLTNNDLRMIALQKLKLKEKEIAQVLNIQIESVRKAKSRLNKKIRDN